MEHAEVGGHVAVVMVVMVIVHGGMGFLRRPLLASDSGLLLSPPRYPDYSPFSRKGTMTKSSRGALIVVEGLDRAGKSSQCERLLRGLLDANYKAKYIRFPGTLGSFHR